MTNGLTAFGAAELRRDLVLATGTPEVTRAVSGVWSVPVALPPILPPLPRRGESAWPTDDEILEAARIAGVTVTLRDPEPYGVIS